MHAVDIAIEDSSFTELNTICSATGITPAEFIRRAAVSAVRLYKMRDATQRDASGYAAIPVEPDEFAVDPDDLQGPDKAPW